MDIGPQFPFERLDIIDAEEEEHFFLLLHADSVYTMRQLAKKLTAWKLTECHPGYHRGSRMPPPPRLRLAVGWVSQAGRQDLQWNRGRLNCGH
jgi:hypothetical protein